MDYVETFEDGPGGWYGWISNAAGPGPLEVMDGCVVSRSPWWIDYNHAPPGAGYMHLLYMLNTAGTDGEHHREVAGENRYVDGDFPTDFTNARITVRLRGELESKGARLHLLCQGADDRLTSGWLLTGQAFEVTEDWSEQTVTAVPDPDQWTCLGSRHDRAASAADRADGTHRWRSSSPASRKGLSGLAFPSARRVCVAGHSAH
jgi:hypothetical protein